jgi:hypothetical protein
MKKKFHTSAPKVEANKTGPTPIKVDRIETTNKRMYDTR